MKKWLAVLLLLAMALFLTSCGGGEPAPTAAPDESASTAIDETAEEQGGALPVTQTETANDLDKTEFIVYEDRIFFISKSSPEVEATLADAMNALFRSLPDSVSKYLMIVPTRIAYEVAEVQELSSDQKAEIKNIYMAIDSTVTLVDAYYALNEHAADLNAIYYRTDHHWTHLGAYYAAQAFFEAAGIAYHPLEDYEPHDGGTFLGYLQDLANDPYFYDKPDSITYYLLPGVNHEEWIYYKNVETGEMEMTETTEVDDTRPAYEKFVGVNGFSHAILFGNEESDRSLLLVGYSFSNAISTWLADSFRTVVLVDPRYYEDGREGLGELMDTYNVTDALLLISTSDSSAVVNNFSSYIGRLIQ